MAPTVQTSEWKILAQQASVEMDGEKLIVIVNNLCAALDAQSRRKPSVFAMPIISNPEEKAGRCGGLNGT
jgi:hypothetical protein